MNLLGELQGLMVKYHFKPDKRLSQNFCISEDTLSRIVQEAHLSQSDTALEIGSGTGFLTRRIQSRCKVIAIEKDDRLFELLKDGLLPKNLELRHEDFLDSKFKKGEFNKIVSLPPYSISSEIVFKILELGFDEAFLIFQKEFAQKLLAEPGFEDYGAISVMTQYFCEPSIVFMVESNAFFPQPQGFSACVRLKSNKRYGRLENEKFFIQFVKELFRYKNKSVSNALDLAVPFLQKELHLSKDQLLNKKNMIPFKDQKVYLLEVSEFVQLFQQIAGNH